MHLRVTSLLVLTLVSSIIASAQVSEDQFLKLLRDRAGFQEADMSTLNSGQLVIKVLPANDKREVAVCGAVRLGKVSELTLTAFRQAIATRSNKAVLAEGKFSSPPVIEDLAPLKLENRDIEELKQCDPGNCDIKISANMINRLRSGVDWDAPDYREQVTKLFSTIIVEYTRDYLVRGDKALIQIDSRKTPVNLPDENREMLERALFIKELAPEFYKYLSGYPRYQMPDVDTGLLWSKISTGIKPIVTITQTSAYANTGAGLPQFVVMAKQVLATRYVESSLAFTYLVSFPAQGATETYLVFTNLSKSDALAGAFGGVKRSLVEKAAFERTGEMLSLAKYRLENPNSAAEPTDQDGIANRLISDQQIAKWAGALTVLLSLIAAIAAIIYRKRNHKISGT